MTEAIHDNNRVPVILGVLNTDGVTPTPVKINPTTHVLQVSDDVSGSDFGNDSTSRDNNGETTMLATDANGAIVSLYVDSSGNLMIKSV